MGLGEDQLLYIDAILERIPLDQIVRKTVLRCDQYKPDFVGIEVEQFQQLLVHEFQRQCRERPHSQPAESARVAQAGGILPTGVLPTAIAARYNHSNWTASLKARFQMPHFANCL